MGIFDFLRGKQEKAPGKGTNQKNEEKSSENKNITNHSVKVTAAATIPQSDHDFDADVIPVEKIIPSLSANSAGLYPHEILALEYAGKFRVGEDHFQSFWWYRYGVKDMGKLLTSLLNRGFVKIGSVSEGLQLYKTDDLKNALTAHELKTSGKKADLISRLVESVPENELEKLFPSRPYVLTAEGKDAIKYDEYVMYAHRYQYEGIDIYTLNRMIDGHTKMYRDYIWGYFNQKSSEYIKQSNFSGYRNIRYQMAQFVMEEGKYSSALSLLTEFVFWETSGLNSGNLFIESTGKYWFPYEDSFIRVTTGAVDLIAECKKKYGKPDEEFTKFLKEEVSRLSAPFHVFTKEEVVEIILMELEKDVAKLNLIYDAAKERLKKKYPAVDFEREKKL